MTIFIGGVILAALVATAYLTLAARDFRRIRAEVNADGRTATTAALADGPARASGEGALDPGRETVGFAWRAVGGVIASVALLYAISHLWWAWYLFPALALGTGVAVSVAFVVDPSRRVG